MSRPSDFSAYIVMMTLGAIKRTGASKDDMTHIFYLIISKVIKHHIHVAFISQDVALR